MRGAELAAKIEHSLLVATATSEDIERLCAEACEHGFYSVCVNPGHVAQSKAALKDSGARVSTVVGFPLGAMQSILKAREAMEAVYLGADEIDMVMDIGAALEGDWQKVERGIAEVAYAIRGSALLKVIIECCYLSEAQKTDAIKVVMNAGADFVKTSTGFGTGGATVEDVALMKRVAGGSLRIKAAGGIKNYAQAIAMIEAGADLLGTSSGVAITGEAAA